MMARSFRVSAKPSRRAAWILLYFGIMKDAKRFECLSRFEERDFVFLVTAIGGAADGAALRGLFVDQESLRHLLDDERVFRALLESPSLLNVSPWFYFYVLTRHSLKRRGLDDLPLAEYLGSILAERVPMAPHDSLRGIPAGFVHTVDFLAVLDRASGKTRYELLVAAGNQFLVLTGIFPGYIRRRSERRGAPGLAYYEEFARASFQEATHHPMAKRSGLSEVFGTLTDVLPEARRSLNRMADSLLFLAS